MTGRGGELARAAGRLAGGGERLEFAGRRVATARGLVEGKVRSSVWSKFREEPSRI